MGTRPYKKNGSGRAIEIPTKKERGFIKDYLATGNGTLAVKKNYRTTKSNSAAAMASRLLQRPVVQNIIQEALGDELLALRHLELLNKRDIRIDKKGEETIEVDLGPDSVTVPKALDMAYKIKGTYAPEKAVTANFDFKVKDKRAVALAEKYEQELKKGL